MLVQISPVLEGMLAMKYVETVKALCNGDES
jgi:hypothetical protein